MIQRHCCPSSIMPKVVVTDFRRRLNSILVLLVLMLGCIRHTPGHSIFISARNEERGALLDSEWREHFSPDTKNGGEAASKVVSLFEQNGRNLVEKDELFKEYANREVDDPFGEEAEYYDEDRPDQEQSRPKDPDYFRQAEYDALAAKREGIQSRGCISQLPNVHDYSLQPNFRALFRTQVEEKIEFDPNYRNPCWAEQIPKFPYQNNTYLNMKEQSKLLEPLFHSMRKKFSARNNVETRWRQRCLPYYYVMETPPLAVPSLFTVLGYHPFVINPELSEPEFWNQRGPDGVATIQDYLDLFDHAAEEIRDNTTQVTTDFQTIKFHKKVTGDSTPSYLWQIDNWRRLPGNEAELTEPKVTTADMIYRLTPNAKIILVLRNPTERLFQGYVSQTDNPTMTDFHDKVGQAMDMMTKCEEKSSVRTCVYDAHMNKRLPVPLHIGMYYPFVEDWLKVFSSSQVKIVRYEDYISSPSEIINSVCSFLGLIPFPTSDLVEEENRVKALEKKRLASMRVQMMSSTRAMLKSFYRNLNQRLAELLDDERFTWPELSVDSSMIDDYDDDDEPIEKKKPMPEPLDSWSRKSIEEGLNLIRRRQAHRTPEHKASYIQELQKVWQAGQQQKQQQPPQQPQQQQQAQQQQQQQAQQQQQQQAQQQQQQQTPQQQAQQQLQALQQQEAQQLQQQQQDQERKVQQQQQDQQRQQKQQQQQDQQKQQQQQQDQQKQQQQQQQQQQQHQQTQLQPVVANQVQDSSNQQVKQ